MDWERPKFNRNSNGVNQARRSESLISYPERSYMVHQQCKKCNDVFYTLQEVSRGHSILLKNRRRSESFNLRSS